MFGLENMNFKIHRKVPIYSRYINKDCSSREKSRQPIVWCPKIRKKVILNNLFNSNKCIANLFYRKFS